MEAYGAMDITSPLLTGANASRGAISSRGALRLLASSAPATPPAAGGLGATLSLGGTSVEINSQIALPSGSLSIQATSGNVQIGNLAPARIDLAGTTKTFLDVTKATGGGNLTVRSDTGSVFFESLSTVDVSSPGVDAGSLTVEAPLGSFALNGTILGSAGTGRRTGSFLLDAASVVTNDLAATDARLNAGNFSELRDYRIRTGNLTISGAAQAATYRVGVDAGNLNLTGQIDASGVTGDAIELAANGSLTLGSSAKLDVSADKFDAGGKGGSVLLSAGTSRNGVVKSAARLNLQSNSVIDLSVAANLLRFSVMAADRLRMKRKTIVTGRPA